MDQARRPQDEPSAKIIESIAQNVMSSVDDNSMEDSDDLLKVSAVVHALMNLGMKTRVDVTDVCYEDSDYEGSRVFAFLIGNEPCDLHGNMGWDDIVEHYVQSHEITKDREWFLMERMDAASVINDEVSQRQRENNFADRVAQLGGGALANIHAKHLEENSAPAPFSKKRRIGL